MTHLLWFRKDLRFHDNETLLQAAGSTTERESALASVAGPLVPRAETTSPPASLLPVFVLPDRELRLDPLTRQPRMSALRRNFLQSALIGLQTQFRKLRSDLYTTTGNAAEIFAEIHARSPIDAIFAQELPGTEEETDLDAVEEFCFAHGIRLHLFDTHTLTHPDDLPFEVHNMPDIFTPFRGKVEKYAQYRDPLPAPVVLPPLPESAPFMASAANASPASASASTEFAASASGDLVRQPYPFPDICIPGSEDAYDSRTALSTDASEQAALLHLHAYIHERKLIRTYKDTRNGLIGSDYSAKLSGWLALGSLSPRTIRAEVARHEAQHGANESTYWLIFELLWRDYFQFLLYKYHNRLFLSGGIPEKTNPRAGTSAGTTSDRSEAWPTSFRLWTEGRTGLDFVDANMIELRLTGFMSNRGRQNVASWLTKTAGVDWRLGAAWFQQHLLDYDVASNWGNWAYVAGVGTDPRDRTFNIARQAEMYDGDHQYRNLWLRQ